MDRVVAIVRRTDLGRRGTGYGSPEMVHRKWFAGTGAGRPGVAAMVQRRADPRRSHRSVSRHPELARDRLLCVRKPATAGLRARPSKDGRPMSCNREAGGAQFALARRGLRPYAG